MKKQSNIISSKVLESSKSNPPKLLESKEQTEFADAFALVSIQYSEQRQPIRALPAVKKQFGNFFAFTDGEVSQLSALRDLILRYISQRSPAHPLCLAIFGPPGSGKSFAVKQILKVVEKEAKDPKPKLSLTIVNLTQIAYSIDLGRMIARIAGEQDEDTVPIVFFDEFDAARDGASYGWFQWFLAPMHDGEFLHEGAVIRLKRAVYVFAGGTADTMSEFSSPRSVPAFRAAKGPDFISRLRGFLDVLGPNAEPRIERRAILFRNELQERASRGRHEVAAPTEELLKALLTVRRYRHGARSISAIIELSDLENNHFGWSELPEDHLLGLHIDRGPLDMKLIGGSIALSGSTPPVGTQNSEDHKLQWCWLDVAQKLWQEGATLSYAESWQKDEWKLLMGLLAPLLRNLPVELSRMQERRDRPSPWLVSFLKVEDAEQEEINSIMDPEERTRYGLKLSTKDYLTNQERSEFVKDAWSAQVIECFRRRLAVSEASVARFAMAGQLENPGGRGPSVIEELMLTLALQKPIYVAGGFGGAALTAGKLLGLAQLRTGDVPKELSATAADKLKLNAIADQLRPGPWTSLPVIADDIALFLKDHAIGGPKWPDNGLSTEENRYLFESTECQEVAEFVAKGLRNLFSRT